MRNLILIIISSAALLSACTSKTNTQQIAAPLPAFEQTANVKQVWQKQAGHGGGKYYLRLTPSVTDEVVYTSSKDGTVAANAVSDGHMIWKTKLPQQVLSSPGSGNGQVYVVTDEALLVALNAFDGKEVWRTKISNQVLGKPTVANNKVLIKTIDGTLAAYDATTGEKVWDYENKAPYLILRAGSSPQVDVNAIITGFSSGSLVLLSPDTGQLLWDKKIVQPSGYATLERMVDIDADPLKVDDVLYVATYQGNISALGFYDAQLIWRHELSSYTGMDIAKNKLFVTDAEGFVWCFDRKTGHVLWRQNQLQYRQLTAPVAYGSYLVITDKEGYVHWLSQEDGHFVARQFVNKSGFFAPAVVADDNVLVYGNNGSLTAFRVV